MQVFYHIAAMPGWREIVFEQIELLSACQLQQVNVIYLGKREDWTFIQKTAEEHSVVLQLLESNENFGVCETLAMECIEQWAQTNDGPALYFHTKGASRPKDSVKRRWRQLMQDHTIKKWRENLTLLSTHDAVGVNWQDLPGMPHFSGNFWMANGGYIRSLEAFSEFNRRMPHGRVNCELWIGASSRVPKIVSLVYRNTNFFHLWPR
jgi:hypothetical protein